nr:hypothetical protein [Cressdnaviricota sp.]
MSSFLILRLVPLPLWRIGLCGMELLFLMAPIWTMLPMCAIFRRLVNIQVSRQILLMIIILKFVP